MLAIFWAVVVLASGAGAVWLQYAGPHLLAAPVAEKVAPPPVEHPREPSPVAQPVIAAVPPGSIAPPDPALLEADGDATLPRMAADGRIAAHIYARPAAVGDHRPRVALLVAGYGQSATDSQQALMLMPPEVTFGISPYPSNLAPLLAQTRARGHEYLATLPMESQGYPLNDAGPHALLTGASAADNERNLHWVLSRVPGAAGVTGLSDGLRGERFANAKTLMSAVLTELHQRGLFYVDPRPTNSPGPDGAPVTVVLDDPPTRAELDTRLALLEQRARDNGAALGLVGVLRPAVTERVASWARGLDGRGVALVPVSALEAWEPLK